MSGREPMSERQKMVLFLLLAGVVALVTLMLAVAVGSVTWGQG